MKVFVRLLAGGYFDHDGAVHYNITDYQGSVTMVIDSLRVVEQHNGYYPYGEPWREPGGQPFLYSDKERNRLFNLNDYDFHSRRLTPATALWNAPDPLAGKYPNINPYTYCASNPVMYIDPSGMDIFKLNSVGMITDIELNEEYDQIQIQMDEKTVSSSQYAYGTIVNGESGKTDYLKYGIGKFTQIGIRDVESGIDIFEFLSNKITGSTYVEYSMLILKRSDNGIKCIISTSHEKNKDMSVAGIYEDKYKGTGSVGAFFHSHPESNTVTNKDKKLFEKMYENEQVDPIIGIHYSGSPIEATPGFYIWDGRNVEHIKIDKIMDLIRP